MDPYDSYTGDEATATAFFVIFVAYFAFLAAVLILNYFLTAIPLAALFRKTGVEPWKAWVPYYSVYTWLRLGGQSGHWVWLYFVPSGSIVTWIFLFLGMHRTGKAFGKDTGFLVLGIFLPFVWLFMLGFGRDEYRPELIAAAGLSGPLEGNGAVVPADGIAVPFQYGATPYPGATAYPAPGSPAQTYPAPTYPAPGYQAPADPATTDHPPTTDYSGTTNYSGTSTYSGTTPSYPPPAVPPTEPPAPAPPAPTPPPAPES